MITHLLRATLVLLVLTLPGPPGSAAAAEPPALRPQAGPLDAGSGFAFPKKQNKTRQSLSGIACPGVPAAPGLCLAVFDEGGEARYVTIETSAIKPEAERVALLPGKVELDGEAAATDGQFYYVTGSHSAKRGDCASNPESRHLFRFRLDPATGRGQQDKAGKLVDFADTGALWTVMSSVAGLKEHVGEAMCLGTEPPKDAQHLKGRNGVNIEGMTVRGGRLYFGFRGPVDKDGAKILSVKANELFGGGNAAPELFTVALGKGRAIRDLIAVSDGILVLAGPDDDKRNEKLSYTVSRWNGANGNDNIKPLATLDLGSVPRRDCEEKIELKDIKPEAITVLADKPGEAYQAIVFSDGLCDGGGLRFSIPR
ncbi:MAG TPA: DUF3616 domain-containing protein [Bosea sp. (in: a-proteobacteria)]|jgi:hypothetical protein|uniref:DUF3616 domain-containing protein n=1 Tax=Bosea sp. (in: a-proteobacteria) TaxID=1871050 RepID=UPI002E1129EB|nr:DUF3616 domain-containing protein [Bosea sp. (in: a-proteobacteria)]